MKRGAWLGKLAKGDEVAIKTVLCCETQYDLDWVVKSVSDKEIIVAKDDREWAFSKNKGLKLCDAPGGEQGEVKRFIIKTEQISDEDYLLAEDLARTVAKIPGFEYNEECIWALLEVIKKHREEKVSL